SIIVGEPAKLGPADNASISTRTPPAATERPIGLRLLARILALSLLVFRRGRAAAGGLHRSGRRGAVQAVRGGIEGGGGRGAGSVCRCARELDRRDGDDAPHVRQLGEERSDLVVS